MLPMLSCYEVIDSKESFVKPGMSTVYRRLPSKVEEGTRWSQMHDKLTGAGGGPKWALPDPVLLRAQLKTP